MDVNHIEDLFLAFLKDRLGKNTAASASHVIKGAVLMDQVDPVFIATLREEKLDFMTQAIVGLAEFSQAADELLAHPGRKD